jgi:hypothetical protein
MKIIFRILKVPHIYLHSDANTECKIVILFPIALGLFLEHSSISIWVVGCLRRYQLPLDPLVGEVAHIAS